MAPVFVTAAIFALLFRRIPYWQLIEALGDADYATFLLLMIPNTAVYFCWDTLILSVAIRWFHGPIRYREVLPVRAASYVVALFNTNLARGALAAYLARRLQAPFLPLGGTVIFLVLTEYTHLVAWGALGMLLGASQIPRPLLWIPPAVALFWLVFLFYARVHVSPWTAVRVLIGSRGPGGRRGLPDWAILQTFRLAPARRYVQIVALRAPMFFVSLCLHYLAARTFGIAIPFVQMLSFLPIIFMLAALPITVAHLGTTQAAWVLFFGAYAPAPRLLAFSLAAHGTFTLTRALIGVAFTPLAYRDLAAPRQPVPSTAC